MERDPGFGSPFTAAIGAEIVVIIAVFAAIVFVSGKVLM